MRIGEFAKRSGFAVDTVRFYEKVGLLKPAKKSNGYRSYCDANVEEAEFINLAKSLGFNLRQIREFREKMLAGAMTNASIRIYLAEKIVEIDTQIETLKRAKKLIQQKIKECHD